MQETAIIEEAVRFGSEGRLAGVLHYPAEAHAEVGVLLCSPHPNFAGDLDNNVIQALARLLSTNAIVLRFDYRGIGNSSIELPEELSVFDYWEDVEERRDYADALADSADAANELHRISVGLPLIAAGYSFGAITATLTALRDERFIAMVGVAPPLVRIDFEFLADCRKPCLMLSGNDDFVYDAATAQRLISIAGQRLTFDRIEGMDRFFRDQEAVATERVARFIRQIRSVHAD